MSNPFNSSNSSKLNNTAPSNEKQNADNQSGYDRWSEFYDLYPNPTVAMDDRVFPLAYGRVVNKKVLEVACGTGRHTKRLIHQGNFVWGIDLSAGMLAKAREKIPDPAFQPIHGDFLKLEHQVEDFDAVIVSLALEHFKDLDAFFAKAAASLKSSGELFISEIHPERTSSGVFAHFRDPNSGEEIHLESFPHTEKQIVETAKRAGFSLSFTADGEADEEFCALRENWTRFLGSKMVRVWIFHRKQ